MPSSWSPDVLEGFESSDLDGPTLVRLTARPRSARAAILHVHGYNDYFFQSRLAHDLVAAGFVFYAVDLRGAGRSLRAGEIPHFMRDISEPGDDIAAAAAAIGQLEPDLPLVVHAHSTGGLSATVWAADRPSPTLAGLILDSPLFGRREHGYRKYGALILPMLAAARPLAEVSHAPSVYAQHLHVDGGGEWEFDTSLKRPAGVPARAVWARAVLRAQQRIAKGDVTIAAPVLVARASETGPESAENPRLHEQDIVVDVDAIARLAPRLGSDVSELVVSGGIHELSLSREPARTAYLDGVNAWLDRVVP